MSSDYLHDMTRLSQRNLLATALGVMLMLIALICSTITLSRGTYAAELTVALICALLAVLCFTVPMVRGPLGWRVAAVVLALPALHIVGEFIRRAPHAFGAE